MERLLGVDCRPVISGACCTPAVREPDSAALGLQLQGPEFLSSRTKTAKLVNRRSRRRERERLERFGEHILQVGFETERSRGCSSPKWMGGFISSAKAQLAPRSLRGADSDLLAPYCITAANPPRSWFDARRAHALRVEPGVFCTSARTDCVAGVVGLELRNPLGSKSARVAGEFQPI